LEEQPAFPRAGSLLGERVEPAPQPEAPKLWARPEVALALRPQVAQLRDAQLPPEESAQLMGAQSAARLLLSFA
jgi:hypothetical protein